MDYPKFLKSSAVLLVSFLLLSYLLSLVFGSQNLLVTFLITGIVIAWQFIQCNQEDFGFGMRVVVYLAFTLTLSLVGFLLMDTAARNIWSVLFLSLVGSTMAAGFLKKREHVRKSHSNPPNK